MNLKSKLVLSSAGLMVSSFMVMTSMTGCSSSTGTTTPTGTDSSKVIFTSTETTRFDQSSDVNGTITPSGTFFTQAVVAPSVSWLNRTSTILKNTYSDTSIPSDSDIYYQATNDDLYKVDFSLEPINTNAQILGLIGGKIHLGFVLEAKLASAAGTTWKAYDTTVVTSGTVSSVHITDNGTMMADTVFTLGAKTYTDIKHVHHSFVGVASIATANAEYDVYFSPSLGSTVIYWLHPVTLTVGGTQNGVKNVLTAHTS